MSHNRKKDVAKSKVRGVEIEFDHTKLASILGIPGNNGICEYIKEMTRENGVWWIGSGENWRRDDDVDAPEEEVEEEEEGNQADFDWEVVVDEVAVEGESGSGEKFYDVEDKDQGSPEVNDEIPTVVTQDSAQQKEKESSGVDPSCPTGRIPEAVMLKFQAEFERTIENRFQADLEKAQAENARLLALLQQAQSKPKP
ncbi:hypothetical protein Dimus_003923 [Dionaea muscipula]